MKNETDVAGPGDSGFAAHGRAGGSTLNKSSGRQGYRWLSSASEIMEAEEVRRNPGAGAFAQLILGAGKPLEGSLTILFDGIAMHFGRPASARKLTRVQMDDPPLEPVIPTNGGAGPLTAEACGLDPTRDDCGLEIDETRRHPLPRERDLKPGEWVDPVVIVRDPYFFSRVLVQRNLGLGEAFLAGHFEMLRGSVHHFDGADARGHRLLQLRIHGARRR